MSNKYMTMAVSVAVIALMLTCSLSSVVDNSDAGDVGTADKQTFKYVSMGDSMSAGYGLFGYYVGDNYTDNCGFLMDVPGTYPTEFAEYLKETLTDYNVEQDQLATSANRTLEYRALIDDSFIGETSVKVGGITVPGDEKTYSWFYDDGRTTRVYAKAAEEYPELAQAYPADYGSETDTFNIAKFQMLQQVFRTELSDVDLVTINPHYDFAWAISAPLGDILKGKTPSMNYDFTLYADKELVESAMKLKAEIESYIINLAVSLGLDADTMKTVVSIADIIATGSAYAVVGYCENMDAVCDYIYSHNVDAKVVVIDTYNLFSSLNLVISDGFSIDLADVYQMILDFSNNYEKYLSPYAYKNYHVDIDYLPTLLGDEFKNYVVTGDDVPAGDKITDAAKAAVIYALGQASPDLPAQASSVVKYNTYDAYGKLSEFLHYIFCSTDLSMDVLSDSGIIDRITKKTTDTITAIATDAMTGQDNTVITKNDDGTLTVTRSGSEVAVFSVLEQTMLFMNLFSFKGDGILAHPSTIGYAQIEATLEKAVVDQGILSEPSEEGIAEKIYEVVNGFVTVIIEKIRIIIEALISMFTGLYDEVVEDLKI